MHPTLNRMALAALGLALSCLAAQAQQAAAWPTKAIRFIVPAAAGGPTDFVGRVIAQELSTTFGHQVWVDNKPGAGHLIGTTAAATAAPDGYTFELVSTPHVVNPWLHKDLPYKTEDLQAVSWLASSPLVLVVHPSLPANSVQELVALAKAKPGGLFMASAGNATGPHLAGELFRTSAGIRVEHVPYRGGPQATAAMLSGEVSFYFDTPAGTMPHVKKGALRALAMTFAQRMDTAPEIPTLAESGFPGYEFDSWTGLVAPAGVPKDIIRRMEAEVAKVLGRPDIKERLASVGFTPVGAPAEAFAALVARDLAKWEKVIKEAGIKAD